ncbi:carbohydrate ABC transporter permease [Murimonas intestini]|uniref:carbohydrate ABC transporter permease n=1 Tax=Murimonas intestini TaxID=1337051 RepID=UPI0011DDC0BA|nr:sugar ABC transporter permease [Murimonas intestini]
MKKKVYLIFILPSLLVFLFAIVIPFFMGINIMFTNWDGISRTYEYVGLKNFMLFFTDKSVIKPIITTLAYGFGYTLLNNLFALSLGVLLNKFVAGKKGIKTIFFLPMVLSAVLASFIWGYIFKDILSQTLGINSLLGNPKTALLGVMIIALWNSVGSNLIIYLAGLENISATYYEAGEIDGANGWQAFRYITLPLLVPTFTICITLTLTTALREFATVMAATGGGPAGSTETLSIYIYNNLFSFMKAGYGQAASFVFMVVLVLIASILMKFFRSKEVETQ